MADTAQSDTARQPLYYEVSPNISMAIKVIGICTTVMVILSFIFCMVKGAHESTFYLLACNLIISSIIAGVTAWWYRSGDLQPDKHWFVILVGAVIIFQCLTTDVYVFHVNPSGSDITTTPSPITTVPT